MLQEYDRFPQWLIDVEEGIIFSKSQNRIIGYKSDDYITISLENNQHLLAHRIIWECVNGEIPKDEKGNPYHIHHIDGNKYNNSIHNLELLHPSKHISKHMIGNTINNGRIMNEETKNKISISHINNIYLSKPVLMLDKITEEVIEEYPSISEASRQNKCNHSKISLCCQGKRKTHNNKKWKFK